MMRKTLLLSVLFLSISLGWSQGFRVSGNQLLDANGNNFVMKGVNVPLAWFVNDVNNNIASIKAKTGANCMRIVVTTSTSDNAWQTCVQRCIDNKIIPMVELHDVTGNNSPSELNRMAQFWASKASYLTRPEIARYILINIANEWSDWNMGANATGTLSRDTWKNAWITAVKTVRNAGIKTTLVVDAPAYGQDNRAQAMLYYAKDVQAADPQKNCLFSVHMYCEWRVGGNSSVTSLLPAIKNSGIPIIVGEFGFQHSEGGGTCDINESQIISTANSNGIGWLAWSWKGNGGGVEYLDLSSDWAGNSLSAWGNTVVNGSGGTKTAVNASVFTTNTNTPPSVSLTAPANNASFAAPGNITISANASDANGSVSTVQFYNGATLLGSDATAPYSFSWTGVGAGTYSITARATDNQGAITTSSAVSITVTSGTFNTLPSVSLTAPANNATFAAPASINLSANASDADGSVSNVQFYNGSTLLGSDATAPYSFSWTGVGAGTYSITARATDNQGAMTTSSVIVVTVTNVTTTATIIGPDCSAPYSTISFELNSTKRTNVTSYGWWFTGSASSVTPVSGAPYKVNVQTGQYYNGGEICVGTNLSVYPYYVSYCKSITRCSGARTVEDAELSEMAGALTVSPNPSSADFTFVADADIHYYEVISKLGATVMKGQSVTSGQTVQFGEAMKNGVYTLRLVYANGKTDSKMIQKIQ